MDEKMNNKRLLELLKKEISNSIVYLSFSNDKYTIYSDFVSILLTKENLNKIKNILKCRFWIEDVRKASFIKKVDFDYEVATFERFKNEKMFRSDCFTYYLSSSKNEILEYDEGVRQKKEVEDKLYLLRNPDRHFFIILNTFNIDEVKRIFEEDTQLDEEYFLKNADFSVSLVMFKKTVVELKRIDTKCMSMMLKYLNKIELAQLFALKNDIFEYVVEKLDYVKDFFKCNRIYFREMNRDATKINILRQKFNTEIIFTQEDVLYYVSEETLSFFKDDLELFKYIADAYDFNIKAVFELVKMKKDFLEKLYEELQKNYDSSRDVFTLRLFDVDSVDRLNEMLENDKINVRFRHRARLAHCE